MFPTFFHILPLFVLICYVPEYVLTQPIVSVIVSADECPSPTSVFFDEKQNIILAACADQIISIQLPQRTVSVLVSDSVCWAPSQLIGDASRGIAFAACQNLEVMPPNAASSIMLAGPKYSNVSIFTNFANCSWVGGFAWDIHSTLPLPMMYMTCMSSPAIIAKSSGANQTVIPLVNNTVECDNSAIAVFGEFLYTGCGNNEQLARDTIDSHSSPGIQPMRPSDTALFLVSLHLPSLEMRILSSGDGSYGWLALSIVATGLSDDKTVQLLYGCKDVVQALVQNGQIINTTVLANDTQCVLPKSIALRESIEGNGSHEAFVACAGDSFSIISTPLMPAGNVSSVTTDQECDSPVWNVWHSPSACLFAACNNGAIISVCNPDILQPEVEKPDNVRM